MKVRPQFLMLVLVVSAVTIAGLQFNLYHIAKIENLAAASTFNEALSWVIAGGYVLMFIGMTLEGPVVTAAAAFAAALGYFNFWIVFALAVAGDLVGDFIYYAVGYYFGRAYDTIAHYIQNGEYFILVGIVAVVFVYYLYKKAGSAISVRLEKI